MGRIRTLLTIDWDFFIPLDLYGRHDYAFNSSPLFLLQMWETRRVVAAMQGRILENEIKPTEYDLFWSFVVFESFGTLSDKTAFLVSENHDTAFELAEKYKVNNIISFDAHTDLVYKQEDIMAQELNVGNWLGKWLKGDEKRKATIVLPDHSAEAKSHHCFAGPFGRSEKRRLFLDTSKKTLHQRHVH